MLKSLHITNAYHQTSGGIRTFYRALLAEANVQRRPLRLVVPGPDEGVEEVGAFGRIYFVKANPAPAFDRRYRMIMPRAYLPPADSAIERILLAEQPDLVEVCDKYSVFYVAAMIRKGWFRKLRRPTLVGLSCERMGDNLGAFVSHVGAARLFCERYLRHIYGPPFDYHIANSEYTADELRRALWDRAPDFVQVCGMGVDADAFGPEHRDDAFRRVLLNRAGGDASSVLLFYAGRLSPEKNPRLLIDTLAQLANEAAATRSGRDYRLVIAGDGPLAASLMADARRRAPGRALWLGNLQSREELARCYASADVFVHANPREPFGIAPLEAMASGVPVVVPRAGGVLTYAHDGNAWLAAPNATAFARAVRSAAEEHDAPRLAEARATATAYRWGLVAARFFELYEQLDVSFRGARRVMPRLEQPLAV